MKWCLRRVSTGIDRATGTRGYDTTPVETGRSCRDLLSASLHPSQNQEVP
jgi:hypothetical protein